MKRFPGTRGAGGRDGGRWAQPHPLDPDRGRDHRPARRRGALIASAELDELVRAGGDGLARGCWSVSSCACARSRELGRSRSPSGGAATIAAGGKRLRPLLVLLAAGPPPVDPAPLVRAAVAVELVHARRSCTTTCSTRRACAAASPTVWAAAGRERRDGNRATLLFSRAFAELARNGDAEQVRLLSRASLRARPRRAAAARGRLARRRHRRTLSRALRAEDGAPVRGGLRARRAQRRDGHRDDRARCVRPPDRARVPVARRRPRRQSGPSSGPVSRVAPICSTARSHCR